MIQGIEAGSTGRLNHGLPHRYVNGISVDRSYRPSISRSFGIVVAGTALISICAHVSFPLWFTPVPLTMQPFAVLLLGLLLRPRLAVATMVTYLAEGAAGLPVFTPHGLGGVAQLLGPTGGYLLSYPLTAPLVAWAWRSGCRNFARGLWIAGAGSLITLTMGALWLGVSTHSGLVPIFDHAILPFLPGDLLKVLAAAGMGAGIAGLKRD